MTRKNSRNERRSLPAIATLVLLATVFVAFGYASPLVAASQIDPHTSVQQAESQGAPSGGPEALHLIIDRSLVVTSPRASHLPIRISATPSSLALRKSS